MFTRRSKLAAALFSLGFFLAEAKAQDMDISRLLPPIRGLDFNEPRADPGERGPIEPDPLAMERISLIADALSWLGTPYRYGGMSRSGVDCSGFLGSVLAAAIARAGPFPRKTDEYASFGIAADSVEPGDILLFAINGEIYHVGLALGAESFIHAASEGSRTGVIISSIHEGNWASRMAGIRRIR